MKGVTSNHFLRSENKPGDWASGQETLTFNQAYEQAVCFAVATARHGIGPGKRVGVYCSNGVEYTLAILGCHLSGAAAVDKVLAVQLLPAASPAWLPAAVRGA